jgi:hypothetical protein
VELLVAVPVCVQGGDGCLRYFDEGAGQVVEGLTNDDVGVVAEQSEPLGI